MRSGLLLGNSNENMANFHILGRGKAFRDANTCLRHTNRASCVMHITENPRLCGDFLPDEPSLFAIRVSVLLLVVEIPKAS